MTDVGLRMTKGGVQNDEGTEILIDEYAEALGSGGDTS